MTAISEFLLARIAEDEAVAEALVIPAHDGYRPHPALARWRYEPGEEVEYERTPEMGPDPYGMPFYVTCDSEGLSAAVDEITGTHIARFDPARVLAECAAKRRIIELHQSWPVLVEGPPDISEPDEPFVVRLSRQIGWLTEQEYVARFGSEPPTTPIVAAMAEVYADHPDYRDEWRLTPPTTGGTL